MCLAIPAVIKSIQGQQAIADIEGVTREISLQLTPEAKVGDYVLLAAGYPSLEAAVRRLGYPVLPLEMSEYQKMDGGLSCLSLRF